MLPGRFFPPFNSNFWSFILKDKDALKGTVVVIGQINIGSKEKEAIRRKIVQCAPFHLRQTLLKLRRLLYVIIMLINCYLKFC